jgi:hypothetical protein
MYVGGHMASRAPQIAISTMRPPRTKLKENLRFSTNVTA